MTTSDPVGEAERLEGLAGVLVLLSAAQVNQAAAMIYAEQASEYQRRATELRRKQRNGQDPAGS